MDLIDQVRKALEKAPESVGEPDGQAAAASLPAAPAVDKDLSKVLSQGIPAGTPLRSSLKQAFVTRRPEWYKTRVADQYRSATDRVRKLYLDIDAKAPVTGSAVKSLAASFISLLKSDRNLLLNLAYLPTEEKDLLFTQAVNTCLLSMSLAGHAGYSEDQTMDIAAAALLEDIGMIKVPEAIRNKAGRLDADELFEVHKHPMVGADLIANMNDLSPSSVLAIYQHHERMSGVGYPRQRPGHLIHEYSRILAIADTYAAMISKRSYREGMIPYQAMESIIKMGSAGLLDPVLIRKFLGALSLFPVGSLVRLASGSVGKIVQANEADFSRPLVAVLRDGKGATLPVGTLLDLAKGGEDRVVEALAADTIPQQPMEGF